MLHLDPSRTLQQQDSASRLFELEKNKSGTMERIVEISNYALGQIFIYVETNYLEKVAEAQQQNRSIYIRPNESGIIRALTFTPKGDVFLLLNRSKRDDIILAETRSYKDQIAYNLSDGQEVVMRSFRMPYLSDYSQVPDLPQAHLKGYRLLEGVPGFDQVELIATYPYKSKQLAYFLTQDRREMMSQGEEIEKTRVVFRGSNRGTLKEALFPPEEDPDFENILAGNKTFQVFSGLIDRIYYLHTNNLMHGNLSTSNILLQEIDSDANSSLVAIISGLESVCHINDIKSRHELNKYSKIHTSAEVCPPELASLLLRREKEAAVQLQIQAIMTAPSTDVWQLGCLFYQLITKEFLPWEREDYRLDSTLLSLHTITSIDWFQEPENRSSPLHLIWQMLQKDPEKRPSIQQIKADFSRIDWRSYFDLDSFMNINNIG